MNPPTPMSVQVGTIHYQILCGAGLALVFLAQLEEGMLLGSLLVVCVGLLGLISGIRVGPMLTLFVFFVAQVGNHLILYRSFGFIQRRPFLHLGDLILAIGILAYVAGHYRLQSLWRHVLPVDSRQKQRSEAKGRRGFEQVRRPRAERLLTPQEIATFVISLPLWALLGQIVWAVVGARWLPSVWPERVLQLMFFGWMLICGSLVSILVLSMWRRRQMTRAAAQLCLQDLVWAETRREQRRIFRWLAWRKVREIDTNDTV